MKRIDLSRLQPRFAQLLDDFMLRHNINQAKLARLAGMERSHLNALQSINKVTGKFDRKLSAYYLFKFIMRGIIKVADINDGKPESDREEDFWAQATEAENLDMLNQIAFLRKKGVDMQTILKPFMDLYKNGK